MKKLSTVIFVLFFIIVSVNLSKAEVENEIILFHLKTSLKHDDAQLCVAYNVIWAALDDGLEVNVLIDADAVNTYKVGWRGKDGFEDYKMPDNLRSLLSKNFNKPLDVIPKTYGEFLHKLHEMGAVFYINSGMLVVAKIEDNLGETKNIGPEFFKAVSLKEMIKLRKEAKYYMVY